MDKLFILLSVYNQLPPKLIDFLKEKLRSKTIGKGEILVREGEINRYIYFIERGITRTFTRSKKGEHTTWLQMESEFVISVDSFFNQTPSAEWIVAQTRLTVRYISHAELEEACRRWPEFAVVREEIKTEYYKRKILWDRWIRTTGNRERYVQFVKEQPILAKRISLDVMSSYLCMGFATLKRIRQDIRDGH
jgi:CRP-like cAMP-binding protein